MTGRDAGRVPLDVRIEGSRLPGRAWAGRSDVRVGIQRGAEVPDAVLADAPAAVLTTRVDVVDDDAGMPDFRGPAVHGRRGARFLYLSWGDGPGPGGGAMFRRAKLLLSELDPALVRDACTPGATLVGALALTGDDGGPVCAAVRPPRIAWRVER